MTAAEIARALPRGRKSGAGYVACCPAHEDRNPSLSLRDSNGHVLVHCHAGCPQESVIGALIVAGLWPERECRPLLRRREYARAAAKADTLAVRLADFATGLELVTARMAALSSLLLELGIGTTPFDDMHRYLHEWRSAAARDIAECWRAARSEHPAAVARMESIGRSDRQHTETITWAIVHMLAAEQSETR